MPRISQDAERLRENVLTLIQKQYPNGAHPRELQIEIMGDTDDLDEHRRRQQRMFHAFKALIKSKHLVKRGHGMASTYTLNNGRPKVEVKDLPANGHTRRPYKKRAQNDDGNNRLLRYILRDLHAKIAELETHLEL